MSALTPLTSKDGQSEWPYKGKTIIAIKELVLCRDCIIYPGDDNERIEDYHCNDFPCCMTDFAVPIIFIEKPAETK